MSPKRIQSSANDPIIIAIRKAAEAQGFKAHTLAAKTGFAVYTCQRLLAGEGSPSLATLRAVCAVVELELGAKGRK